MKTHRILPPACAVLLAAGLVHARPNDPPGEGPSLPPPTQDDGAEELGLREALAGGHSWVKFRYRFENVDDDAFSKDANASTLRTLLGYETATWKGLSVLLEAEDVSPIGNRDLYNDGVNGVTDRPAVIDPNGTEANQAYLQYAGWPDTTLRAGRQRITLDNHRFVGNVGWRQNEQTFDAYSVSTGALDEVDFYLAYVTNANRVNGEDSPVGNTGMASVLFNASHEFEELGKLVGYVYELDYHTLDALSTTTFGASFAGRYDGESLDVLYRAELADQSDTGDNPNSVDAGYLALEAGVDVEGVVAKVGWELLEGSGDPGDAFNTPLATLHAFNGWADKFLVTPDTGLEDLYLSVGYDWSGTELLAVLHDFSSASDGLDYGTEVDLQAVRTFECGVTGGLKLAAYSADDFAEDTTKAWLWVAYSF